ncbi:MAG: hypothetical protein JWM53_6860 [bacterium]|nr:hypothetical protein [bacterium]
MKFERAIWKAEFTRSSTLPWACASCAAGRLRLDPNTLANGETRDSKVAADHPASDPEWTEGRFSCLMECPHCGGHVGVAGKYRVQDDRHWNELEGETGDYENYYRPLFFTESPHVVAIPEATPDAVTAELVLAFQLFWSDPGSCANHIRSAVERLLTAQRIPQTNGRTAKTGGRRFLTLATRVERFRARHKALADSLDAIRWLGNAGSHADTITCDDVLDGFEILEHVLDTLYVKRERRVGALTRAINRRKGPRSRRRPTDR